MSKLPVTKARLSTSAKFLINTGDIDITSVQSIANSGQWRGIGSVERFEEGNPRGSVERYQLDYTDPGEIVERIPELVKRSLTIAKAVLYREDMMQLFGSTDFNDIIDQYKSFSIQKIEIAPEGSNVPSKTTYFTGCWFHENPKTYDISRELKMVQTISIGYTRRFVSTSAA